MLYLILLLPVALAVCCCVLRPDGGRARSAVLLAVQGAELLLVLLAVCRGAELVSPVWHMSEAGSPSRCGSTGSRAFSAC